MKEDKSLPVFSILMCVYNQTDLLDHAILSVQNQQEMSWELLILDNSDSNRDVTWGILEQYAVNDSRIHVFRNSRNEGWAKGTAWLMDHVSGMYLSFLAADDFLLPDALGGVKQCIEQEAPDIVWVGNGFYQYGPNGIVEAGDSVLPYRIVLAGRKASNIKCIMDNTFYNSMFHYEKVSFLRKCGIDFYDPFYGDCVGMTKAMAEPNKMLILDQKVYGLVANTSQTRGKYFWDGIQYIFVPQWNCIKDAYKRDAYFSFQEARFCAIAVLRGITRELEALLGGAVCMDKEMNPTERDSNERWMQAKTILQHPVIQGLIQLYGRFEYESVILELFSGKFMEQYGMQDWLGLLLDLAGKLPDIEYAEAIRRFTKILTHEENTGMMGMGMFLQYVNTLSDPQRAEQLDSIQKILQIYGDWKELFACKVYSEFCRECTLEGQNRIELAAFCKYILEN